MKVLQINATYGIGSTGVITKELSEICYKNGIKPYAAFSKGHANIDEFIDYYEIGSWLDHKIHAICSRIAGKQGYYSKCATKKFIKFISSITPDVVHLHNLHSNYIHLPTLLQYLASNNIPTVITMHDCWFYTGGCFHYTLAGCEKWKNYCGKCTKQKLDTPAYFYDASSQILDDRIRLFSSFKNLVFVGASKWISGQISESRLRTFGMIECIYNGFDINVYKPRNTELRNILGLTNKFLILGPASKWLLPINKPALEYFSKHLSDDAVLLLFGYNGKSLKLPKNVILYGFTHDRDAMAELYSAADVLVNCSWEDTLSSLNLEAQACGTPVVTYESTGSKETVDGICGFAVKTGDFEELYATVEYVKNLGKLSLSSACRDFILTNFDKYTNYLKYINLYKQIVR